MEKTVNKKKIQDYELKERKESILNSNEEDSIEVQLNNCKLKLKKIIDEVEVAQQEYDQIMKKESLDDEIHIKLDKITK